MTREDDLGVSIDVPAAPRGQVELVADEQHFQRVVIGGILKARTSLDVATADFKAMLIPTPSPTGRRGRGRAESIIEHFRRLTRRGVEIRVLHSGVPSSPALRQLRRQLPAGLTIRRCPRLHAKAVIIDSKQIVYINDRLGNRRTILRSISRLWEFQRGDI